MGRLLTLAVLVALAACKKPESPQRPAASPPVPAASGTAAPSGATAAGETAAGAKALRGKILEKIDVSQYSYLKLATASGETWAAVQRTDRKVGDEVGVGNAFPMRGFESKELNRKFDVVYFGTLAGPGGEVAPMPPAMGGEPGGGQMAGGGSAPTPANMAAQHQAVASGPADVKVEKIARAAGTDARTVQEIWSQRQKLKGKPVLVRGQVVKFTPVMGKNFLHLRDGSGDAGNKDNDVTVTTADSAAVGDVVTARGTVAIDRDFGSGYAYPVMIEDAKVSK
jgi:hypothetical protein